MASLFIPRSVDELEASVRSSAVAESAYLDFKQFPPMNSGGRKALAKDLAALASTAELSFLESPKRAMPVRHGWC